MTTDKELGNAIDFAMRHLRDTVADARAAGLRVNLLANEFGLTITASVLRSYDYQLGSEEELNHD